jgi:single-stranded-DNA-specific exonuclease
MGKQILNTKVAGVTYEGRQDIIAALKGNEPCRIVPEPENPYDPNALAVHVAVAPGVVRHVGFVPRDLAAQIAPHLEGEAVMVELTEITGGFETRYGDIAAYGLRIRIEIPDTTNA